MTHAMHEDILRGARAARAGRGTHAKWCSVQERTQCHTSHRAVWGVCARLACRESCADTVAIRLGFLGEGVLYSVDTRIVDTIMSPHRPRPTAHTTLAHVTTIMYQRASWQLT